MRKFIIASVVALAASMPFGVSTASADVILRLDTGPHRERIVQHRRHGEYRHHHRHWRHHQYRHWSYDRDCYSKRVVYHHHGNRVVKVERICR